MNVIAYYWSFGLPLQNRNNSWCIQCRIYHCG